MKLIYIANIRIPTEKAHGIQIMKMCETFAGQNFKLELMVPKRFNSIKENPFKYYGLENNFKIIKIFCFDLVKFGFFGFWVQRISFLFFVRIYLLFKKYDILYTRDEFCGLFFKDFILEIHSFPDRLRKVHKRVYLKAKQYIVLTSFLKKKIINNIKIKEENIIISPDGVDLEKFNIEISKESARKKMSLPLDKEIVMYVGHLYSWKGVQTLADASQFLEGDVIIVFVGGVDIDLKFFKSKNIKYKNIFLLGQKLHSDIPFYLKSADILILPNSRENNISRFYTSPMKLFEYMSSKRSIIASNLPSVREILNKSNSILVESDDPKKLAQKINFLLKNEELQDKIFKQAYIDVKKYTWKNRVKKILKFII